MHQIQKKLLNLSQTEDFSRMGYREIGRRIGEKHPQKIVHHLNQLRKKGLFGDSNKKVKFYRRESNNLIAIPVYGLANCGEATILAENSIQGSMKVSPSILKNRGKKVFAVIASGDSMNKASLQGKAIHNGDYVLVDPNDKNVSDGDYVLSVIDDMANIKKIKPQKGENAILLYSESDIEIPPIYIAESDNYHFCGKVFDVVNLNT